jgi:hypothetical protein
MIGHSDAGFRVHLVVCAAENVPIMRKDGTRVFCEMRLGNRRSANTRTIHTADGCPVFNQGWSFSVNNLGQGYEKTWNMEMTLMEKKGVLMGGGMGGGNTVLGIGKFKIAPNEPENWQGVVTKHRLELKAKEKEVREKLAMTAAGGMFLEVHVTIEPEVWLPQWDPIYGNRSKERQDTYQFQVPIAHSRTRAPIASTQVAMASMHRIHRPSAMHPMH